MTRARRVVVGIDGSDVSRVALHWAVTEASQHGDELLALTAWTALPPPILAPVVGLSPAGDLDDVTLAARRALRAVVADAVDGHPRLEVEVRAAQGHPVELLAEESSRADLVVVGARGRSGIGWLLGSVSQELLRRSSCTVVVVRSDRGTARHGEPAPGLPTRQQMTPWQQVVVGVDGSPPSRSALRWAAAEAREHHATLVTLMAWDPPPRPIPGPYGRPPVMDLGREPHEEVERSLSDLVTEVLGVELAPSVATRTVQGHPATALIDAAKDADLLVLGSRGHGGFAGLLLGSVSQHVVAHAGCTVVIVR